VDAGYLAALARMVDVVVVRDGLVVDATRRTWLIGHPAAGLDGVRSALADDGATVVLLPSGSADGIGGRDRWIAALVDAVSRAARMGTTVAVMVVHVRQGEIGTAVDAVVAEVRAPDVVAHIDDRSLGVVMELAPRDDPRAPLLAAGRMIGRAASTMELAVGLDLATGHYANAERLLQRAEAAADAAPTGTYALA
jgi:hypothetical protein